jgi:hypothetical protein
MTNRFAELFEIRDSANEEIKTLVNLGIATIDRRLWDIDSNSDDLPDIFYIDEIRYRSGYIKIDWYTVFRGEHDLYGSFSIKASYFFDEEECKRVINKIETEDQRRKEKEERRRAEAAEEERLAQLENDRAIFKELSARHEKGEL